MPKFNVTLENGHNNDVADTVLDFVPNKGDHINFIRKEDAEVLMEGDVVKRTFLTDREGIRHITLMLW